MKFLFSTFIMVTAVLYGQPKETHRLGPSLTNGDRWLDPGDHSYMILLPANWSVAKGPRRPSDLEIHGSGVRPAGLVLEKIEFSPTSSALIAAEERLRQLKSRPAGSFEELKSELPNGIKIHSIVQGPVIEGVFVTYSMLAFYFKATTNEQISWRDFKKILGSFGDLNEDKFRISTLSSPQALEPGQWVATADNQWMLQIHQEGWSLENAQNNEVLRLSGASEESLQSVLLAKEPSGVTNPQEMLSRWAEMLGDKNKKSSKMKISDRIALQYASSPDQSELTGYLTIEIQTYQITVLGSPNIDFHGLRRLLGSLKPYDETLLLNQHTDDLPAPPGPAPETDVLNTSASDPRDQLPAPNPQVKKLLEQYAIPLATALTIGTLIIAFFLWLTDQKLWRLGESFASMEESDHLRLYAGGLYLTIFPTYLAFLPGGLALKAVHRKPPLFQALVALYVMRWIAGYLELETALTVLSVILIIIAVLFGIQLGWSIKGTPCWVYDHEGSMVFKIRRQLGWFAYRFVVLDSDLQPIGYLKMSYLSNFIRKQWWILDLKGKTVGHIIEDSIILSILRRLIGHLWGLLRADFQVLGSGKNIGRIKRSRTPFNRMLLDASPPENLDPRLLVACSLAINVFDRDRWYPFWSA